MTEEEHDAAMGDFNTIAMSQPGDKLIAIRTFNVTDTETDKSIIMKSRECVTLLAPPEGSQYTLMPCLYGMAGLGDAQVHITINANCYQCLMVSERRSNG